jgi:hypothetical protein
MHYYFKIRDEIIKLENQIRMLKASLIFARMRSRMNAIFAMFGGRDTSMYDALVSDIAKLENTVMHKREEIVRIKVLHRILNGCACLNR